MKRKGSQPQNLHTAAIETAAANVEAFIVNGSGSQPPNLLAAAAVLETFIVKESGCARGRTSSQQQPHSEAPSSGESDFLRRTHGFVNLFETQPKPG